MNARIRDDQPATLELTPEKVDQLVRNPFGETSSLQLRTMEAGDYQQVPILQSVRYLAEMMEQQGGLKLTLKEGFLQRKVVKELNAREFFPKVGKYDIADFKKVLNEYDLPTVGFTRNLLEFSGLARKYKGKLLVTRRWSKMKQDNDKLLRLVFETFTQQCNWAYFDGYESANVGQCGFALSLALVDKFGDEPLSPELYGGIYFRVFPELLEEFGTPSFIDAKQNALSCYSLRTFGRFLEYFGMVKVHRDEKDYFKTIGVEKT